MNEQLTHLLAQIAVFEAALCTVVHNQPWCGKSYGI